MKNTTVTKRKTNDDPVGDRLLAVGYPEPGEQTAIVKTDPKVGSALPTFSAPPVDQAALSNMNDSDLVFVTKNACSIHAQAGSYAREFLAEFKRRFDGGKIAGKPYFGYKNFNNLCADKLEISARQVRNILNNNPGGRKDREVKPRPSLKDLQDLKAENKRLKAHVAQVEAANERAEKAAALPTAGYTQQEVEKAKEDAVRDQQKIAAMEKRESEKKIAALDRTVHKLTKKQPKQATSKPAATTSKPSFAISQSPIDDSMTWSKGDAVRRIVGWTMSIIQHFTVVEKRWIVDGVIERLRDELAFETGDALGAASPACSTESLEARPQPAVQEACHD
jgi:hypothetical protein